MTDTPSDSTAPTPDANTGGPRWALIAVIVAVVALVVAGALVLLNNDDETDSSTTESAETTLPASTEAPVDTEVPETSAAPETTEAPETTDAPFALSFTIADIAGGGTIPVEFGAGALVDQCDGDNRIPIVSIESVPEGALQLALVVDDPDAPSADPFVHWLVYGIPGNSSEITDGVDGLTYGTTDAGTQSWFGPCPPVGDGPHGYVFTLYALNRELALESGLDGRQLAAAIAEAVVADATVTATYERTEG